jgi:hypothetical protein
MEDIAIKQLMEYGFSEKDCRAALAAHQGDVTQAATMLFDRDMGLDGGEETRPADDTGRTNDLENNTDHDTDEKLAQFLRENAGETSTDDISAEEATAGETNSEVPSRLPVLSNPKVAKVVEPKGKKGARQSGPPTLPSSLAAPAGFQLNLLCCVVAESTQKLAKDAAAPPCGSPSS